MGFRNPIRSVGSVDTGAGNRRVVITQNNSPQGGGQVLLYTSSGQPASLAAGSDDNGIGAVLASPPGAGGILSSVTVRGVAAGGEGIALATPGVVRLYSATSVDLGGAPLTNTPSLADTGWRTIPGNTAAGWSASAGSYRIKNGLVTVRVYATCSVAWARLAAAGTLPAEARPLGTDLGGGAIWAGTMREYACEQGGVLRVIDAGNAGNGVSATITYPAQ